MPGDILTIVIGTDASGRTGGSSGGGSSNTGASANGVARAGGGGGGASRITSSVAGRYGLTAG